MDNAGALEVGANPRYLAELLETMDGTQLVICLQDDAAAPLLFEEVDGDGSLRMVLMPMRLPAAGSIPATETRKRPPEFVAQRPFRVCPVVSPDPAKIREN